MRMPVVYMKQWLDVNGRRMPQDTDAWYLDFANRLLPVLQGDSRFSECVRGGWKEAAVMLSLYLQDSIAQSGGWRTFSDAHRRLFGTPLPFYQTADDYLSDEINREDVALVLWMRQSRPAAADGSRFTVSDPFAPELRSLAEEVYRMMDECFEEAPVADVPSPDAWLMEPDFLKRPLAPLPVVTPQSRLKPDVERTLAYSGGKPLLYFAAYGELRRFFIDVLKWEARPDSLLPELESEKNFVIYANAKGLLLAKDVAFCFRSEDNPCYDAARAAAEAYVLFCRPTACPPDLLRYAMTYGLLPDARFPFPGGKEVLQRNWEFIARYYLKEYFEGD